MKLQVVYFIAEAQMRTFVNLYNAHSIIIHGTRVLRGEQKINGRMVRRSLAYSEIISMK